MRRSTPGWEGSVEMSELQFTAVSCFPRLPVQGVPYEPLLCPEAVLESQAGQAREPHGGRPAQEAPGKLAPPFPGCRGAPGAGAPHTEGKVQRQGALSLGRRLLSWHPDNIPMLFFKVCGTNSKLLTKLRTK